jgi:hypothetical protein
MTTVRQVGATDGIFWRTVMWAAIGGLLLLPAVAMRFTTEVTWDRTDFAAAALLLVGSGLAFELCSRMTTSPGYRAVAGMIVFAAAAVAWADAAVGIF